MKNQYRIPVCYLCCEEGRTWGYKYTRANSLQEAKSDFRDYFSEDDIEEWRRSSASRRTMTASKYTMRKWRNGYEPESCMGNRSDILHGIVQAQRKPEILSVRI